MMEKKDIVIKLCGNYPENFVPYNIEHDPNFSFPNDTNFPSVKLFDYEENTVFVNSFVECEHYVSGGWDYLPEIKNEEFFLDLFIVFSIFSISLALYLRFKNRV